MKKEISRRGFLKGSALLAGATAMAPLQLIELAYGKENSQKFTFAVISDAHITHIKGKEFVRNFDEGLKRAVNEVLFMEPQPDFVVFGGDLAQLGKKEELEHGLEILSQIDIPIKFVIGEHDFYLDMGEYWQKNIAPLNYSFDHKGIHFVVLNSINTYDSWIKKFKDPMERMKAMARLDNPDGSPFIVGREGLDWLEKDLSKISPDTPIVIFTHSPLYKIFKPWNFWTDDAEEVHAILSRFKSVTVMHGHVHQVLYNQINNISFYSFMSTGWPWPYPTTYNQKSNNFPKITVPMNRADPFHERDGTGWSYVDIGKNQLKHHYQLWENNPRTVVFSKKAGYPVDIEYPNGCVLKPPQVHY